MIRMPQPVKSQFLSLEQTKDQLVVAVFICVLLSLFFGLQPGPVYLGLWAALGIASLICIYFAFPHMWPYALLLYACYGISAFAVVLLVFWFDAVTFQGISLTILLGAFLLVAAIYMAFHMIQYVKKARDILADSEGYLPLGFWSLTVFFFVIFAFLSIYSWSFWVYENDSGIQIYMVFEVLLAAMLIYILWLPDRGLDWSKQQVPESPATKFLVDKSKLIRDKVTRTKIACPECGSKLRMEKKNCPFCSNPQTFGWCATSEAYVLPCSHCGAMNLYGKINCVECKKPLSEVIECSSCKKSASLREWAQPE